MIEVEAYPTLFAARIVEAEGDLDVERLVWAGSAPMAIGSSEIQIEPEPPFEGAGTLQANIKPEQWTGDLKAEVPGGKSITLAGPEFVVRYSN